MSQIEKNTVNAKGQLKKTEFVTFINPEGAGKRVMFVGNSITRHGVLPEIGWNNDFGMAASSVDNDYVHIVAKEYSNKNPDAAYCICQVAEWETQYKNGDKTLELFEMARNFDADIIIMRAVENCPATDFDEELFIEKYEELISYLNPSKKAEVIVTTSFWKHKASDALCKIAEKNGYPLVKLEDLGEDESMKAIGLFKHSGVANHPGDKGMRTIAQRILQKLI